jgi:ubiquinone/menaquinone biosynthesis C-methylase UbiE
MNKPKTNIRNLKSAKIYEEYTSHSLKPWDDIFIERCLAENPVKDGRNGRLLDVGTGTAVLLEKLTALAPFKNFELIGIDYYVENVAEANLKLSGQSLGHNCKVIPGDAHELQFDDDSFDMVVSRATLHHLYDPVLAIKEKFRVLKNGGICLIHDMRRDVNAAILEYFNELRAKVNYPPTVVSEKYTIAEVKEFLRQAGLTGNAKVNFSDTGLMALGYEIVLWK